MGGPRPAEKQVTMPPRSAAERGLDAFQSGLAFEGRRRHTSGKGVILSFCGSGVGGGQRANWTGPSAATAGRKKAEGSKRSPAIERLPKACAAAQTVETVTHSLNPDTFPHHIILGVVVGDFQRGAAQRHQASHANLV